MAFEGWIIGGIATLLGSLIGYKAYKKRRAKHGSKREKKLEQKTGLGNIAGLFRNLINRSEQEKKEERKEEKEIKKKGKEGKKQGESKGEKDANQAALKGAKAIKKEEEVQEATEELEARGIGMVASVKAVLDSIARYASYVKSKLQAEEQEVPALDSLISDLNRLENFAAVDQRAASHLGEVFSRITQVIKISVETEREKEEGQKELVRQLGEAAKESRDVVKDEKEAFYELKRAKKKERRNFKQEINAILKSIDDKSKELRKVRQSKGADPNIIAQFQREVALMQNLRSLVQQLNNKLQATYRTLDNELIGLKRIINEILNLVKQVASFDKNAAKREKTIGNRYNELNKLVQELEKSFANLNAGAANLVHQFAINFSGKLKEFYLKYRTIIGEDLVFDEEIQRILLLNITINVKLEALVTLSVSLQQAEKGVEEGFIAITNILQAIVGSPDQKANLQQLIADIKKASAQIDYEATVEKTMQQYLLGMEQQERVVNGRIGELTAEEKNLVMRIDNSNQRQSSHIGQAMGVMMNQKIQLDNTYIEQARQFGQKLDQRNRIAGQAYRQATRMQARATPQPGPRISKPLKPAMAMR